jgi:hypothetical protein
LYGVCQRGNLHCLPEIDLSDAPAAENPSHAPRSTPRGERVALLDAFKAGSKLTDLYELFDEPQYAGTGIAFEAAWGLFNADGTPKPAATALRNLMALIGDNGAGAATFPTCGGVNYTLSGLPGSGQSVLLEKADGTYELVVWNDQNVMAGDGSSHNVSVNLGGNFAYSVFDPLVGTTALQSGNGSSLTVAVSDHPIVIQLGSQGAPAAAPATPVAALTSPASPASPTGSGAGPAAVAVSSGSGPSITVSSDSALQSAIQSAAPGTTIHVVAGTYAGGLDITSSNITIVGDPGATIQGGGTTSNGDMVTIRGDNVTIQGFNISGASTPQAYTLVTTLGSNDKVVNNTIHDLQTGGLNSWGGALVFDAVNGGSGGSALNNTVYNVGPPGSKSDTVQGIYVASKNVTVTGNLIHNIASTCITSWHATSAMTVTYNTCANANQGITVGASDGTTNTGSVVSYNVVTNTGTPIDQEGSTTPATMTGNVVGQPLTADYTLTSGNTTAGYTAAQ